MSIEERVERLEKGNRFWRRFAFVLLILVFAFVASESVKIVRPAGLEARSLAIVDADGRVRVKLGCDSSGNIEQKFFDATGSLRLDLGEGLGGAYLELSDESGKNSLLAHAGGGQVNLYMEDKRGTPRVEVQVPARGSSHFMMLDEEVQERIVVGRAPWLDRSEGATPRNGEGTLRLFDAKGDVIWQAPEKK